MMIVAAIEHAARELAGSFRRALAEKCSGFSDYEAGDHLGAWKSEWFHDRVTREYYRKQLVDQEAEEEVSDQQHYARNLFVGTPYAPAASAGCGESSSLEVSANPPAAPSRERTYTLSDWIAWVTPAIEDVLAEHRPTGGTFVDGTAGKVNCITFTSVHKVCDDWQDWRSHVALLIAQRINIAASQADRPSAIEADARYFASAFFPQSQKRQQ